MFGLISKLSVTTFISIFNHFKMQLIRSIFIIKLFTSSLNSSWNRLILVYIYVSHSYFKPLNSPYHLIAQNWILGLWLWIRAVSPGWGIVVKTHKSIKTNTWSVQKMDTISSYVASTKYRANVSNFVFSGLQFAQCFSWPKQSNEGIVNWFEPTYFHQFAYTIWSHLCRGGY